MTRISVLGNCQVHGIGYALRFLIPDAEIRSFEWTAIKRADSVDQVVQFVNRSNYVFSHYMPDVTGPLSTGALRETVSSYSIVPGISFTGFHPDSIYLPYNGEHLISPIGPYHSRIVAGAYSLGLEANRALSLFNSFVYRKMGYFDEFVNAKSFLATQLKNQGFDLGDCWPSWMEQAPFMHTINHPKGFVLASIARMIARRVSLMAPDLPSPVVPFDWLAQFPIWPVYPELADPLGMPGSYLFKCSGGARITTGENVFINLEEMLLGSYQRYERYSKEVFETDIIKRTRNILSEIIQ